MKISKFYLLQTTMRTLSFGLTGKKQVMIDSLWVDKTQAQAFVKFMKAQQLLSSDPTEYKIIEMKKPIKVYLGCCNDVVFMSASFKWDSVNQYGDDKKDEYYSMQVAVGFEESQIGRVNKKYLYLDGSEVMDCLGFEGKTIKECFAASYEAWDKQKERRLSLTSLG